jgi:hypothetical protein
MIPFGGINYRNWLAGRDNSYRPSRGDLFLAAGGALA